MTHALVVIDVQEEYFAGGLIPLWEPEPVEARIVEAIGQARRAGERVVLVRHVSGAADGPFAPNGAGIAIRPAILAAAGDAPVVTKAAPDAFQDTDLAARLAGVQAVTLCGMMTQNCIVFTALSRAADAYAVRVAGDLCTAPSELVHRIALRALSSKVPVVDLADL